MILAIIMVFLLNNTGNIYCRSLSKTKTNLKTKTNTKTKDVKSNMKMDRINMKKHSKGSLKNSRKPIEKIMNSAFSGYIHNFELH